MRGSIVAERAGVPTVTKICSGFVAQARLVAKLAGMPGARIAEYPGHVDSHDEAQRRKYDEEVILAQVIKALTEPAESEALAAVPEPEPRDIVFKGAFREINDFFCEQEWSDGLPIVPPTVENVEEFLKCTDRAPEEVLAVFPPSYRESTVWNVAVNGVMAGCRPEYMPILIAIVEVMSEPRFVFASAGATPGWETLVILDGPIVKQLGFNHGAGALRPGPRPNTSIGRFYRLYTRNVPGFIPGKTDKSTWGGNFNVVLAENHDALETIGWPPLSVDQGFQAAENVVTMHGITARTYDIALKGNTARENLDPACYAFKGFHRRLHRICNEQSLLLGLTPLNAAIIAREFSKKDVRQYLWEHSTIPAHEFEQFGLEGTPWGELSIGKDLCDAVRQGILPKLYCESNDLNRLLPLWRSPDELRIVVSGDPARDRALVTGANGSHGSATSKKVLLPANWERLPKSA
ncbi:MAG: hypothetical protein HYX90_07915 [Chloroflexi bacterium]|nr:hypothetical protein [Chloroflexota bacterium]